jgi:regulator of replication initiation timing
MVGKLLFQNKISEFKQWFLTIPLSKLNIYIMKKEDLEQLVKDLMEMNKYLIKENEELKNELNRQREVFLESIEKWNKSVERLTKKSVNRHSFLLYN